MGGVNLVQGEFKGSGKRLNFWIKIMFVVLLCGLSYLLGSYRSEDPIIVEKQSLENEITRLEETLNFLKGDIAAHEMMLDRKRGELRSVENAIDKLKEEPLILPPGFYYVGTDIPAGNYRVVPSEGQGKYLVNTGTKVNILLGDDESYVKEHEFTAFPGDVIEQSLTVKYISID
jgi:hypothetical protein